MSYLLRNKSLIRNLLRVVRAYDNGVISNETVAQRFAELNYQVHLNTVDGTVGPRCIVAWRNGKDSRYKGGGGHTFFSETTKDENGPIVPNIVNGMDMAALFNIIMPHTTKFFEQAFSGGSTKRTGPDADEINAQLSQLPHKPDEKLR
jgi:hypothetical protein